MRINISHLFHKREQFSLYLSKKDKHPATHCQFHVYYIKKLFKWFLLGKAKYNNPFNYECKMLKASVAKGAKINCKLLRQRKSHNICTKCHLETALSLSSTGKALEDKKYKKIGI